jgi:ribosomal protein L44E
MTQPTRVNGLTKNQRKRMCLNKARYSDESAAIAGGARSLEQHGEANGIKKLYRYKCPDCKGWHLTRKKHNGQTPITVNLDLFKVAA